MKKSRHRALLEKSVAAAMSSIEIYNKPNFLHREETFAILMISAWEMLLKARILKENKNRISSIYQFDSSRKTKSGAPSKKMKIRRNWANVPVTIGLFEAMKKVSAYKPHPLDKLCAESINALVLIRDAAVHFMNSDTGLSLRVQTYGTANLKNYLRAVGDWFDHDLSDHNLYLMPLSFFPASELENLSKTRNPEVASLLKYLAEIEAANPSEADAPYSLSLRLDLKFVKVSSAGAMPFQKSDDPGAWKVFVTEDEDLRDTWTHAELLKRLASRYLDFKINKKFNDEKKRFEKENRYAKVRFANPKTKKGRTVFYRFAILNAFDAIYTKK
jgi:hypothetical protein